MKINLIHSLKLYFLIWMIYFEMSMRLDTCQMLEKILLNPL